MYTYVVLRRDWSQTALAILIARLMATNFQHRYYMYESSTQPSSHCSIKGSFQQRGEDGQCKEGSVREVPSPRA